jgi:Ca-activated chloride channel family protein
MNASRRLNSPETLVIGLTLTLFGLAVPYEGGGYTIAHSVREPAVSETKISAELVVLTASVHNDTGQPVTDLRHTDFKVFDRDAPQPIDFFSREDQPLSVAIVFDTSRSVAEGSSTRFSAICQGILRFKQESHELNEYTVVGGDLTPQLVTEWTRDKDVLIEGLAELALITPKAHTAIYDAAQFAVKKLNERPTIKSAVILISDGQDGASNLRYSELRDSMLRSNGLIYLMSPSNPTRPLATNGREDLHRLALESGAAAFYPSSDRQVSEAFGAIANELRARYVIGYYPSDRKRDGTWHTVRIKASRQTEESRGISELVVRTRPGYYSPTEPR